MRQNPSHFKGANLPVEQVSWEEATAFAKKLSGKTSVPFADGSGVGVCVSWRPTVQDAVRDRKWHVAVVDGSQFQRGLAVWRCGEGGVSGEDDGSRAHSARTRWDCTTCTGTCGNGVGTGTADVWRGQSDRSNGAGRGLRPGDPGRRLGRLRQELPCGEPLRGLGRTTGVSVPGLSPGPSPVQSRQVRSVSVSRRSRRAPRRRLLSPVRYA